MMPMEGAALRGTPMEAATATRKVAATAVLAAAAAAASAVQ